MAPITESAATDVVARLDAEVNDFVSRVRFFNEPMTKARACMFVMQHRLNTRQRNSVLKLAVATNCPDWETRLGIITACTQEIIADHEFGGGKPHWAILQELGVQIGMDARAIENAAPLVTTQLAWLAWEALMKNRPWLEGIVANTCAERANVPGYGSGTIREAGWFGHERKRWKELFGLRDDQLEFFALHEAADIEHSELGWKAIARYAKEGGQENAVVQACRTNLLVWESYLNGIADAGDAEG